MVLPPFLCTWRSINMAPGTGLRKSHGVSVPANALPSGGSSGPVIRPASAVPPTAADEAGKPPAAAVAPSGAGTGRASRCVYHLSAFAKGRGVNPGAVLAEACGRVPSEWHRPPARRATPPSPSLPGPCPNDRHLGVHFPPPRPAAFLRSPKESKYQRLTH